MMSGQNSITGLALARDFYNYCRPFLVERLGDLMPLAAVGLVGEGSECFGRDDSISRDHDFGPAFCFWLPRDVLKCGKQRLDAVFGELPPVFAGFPSRFASAGAPRRVGPLAIEDFYLHFLGMETAPQNWRQWRAIPEFQLAAATNGEVFEDQHGAFSAIRAALLAYYPRSLWLWKLASAAMQAAQAGQYNLPRALQRGDSAAAMLAAARFAEKALALVFLLNKKYMPFYKWALQICATLPLFGAKLADVLNALAVQPLRDCQDLPALAIIEDFCVDVSDYLRAEGLIKNRDSWLWAHGPEIMAQVDDAEILRLNLLAD